MLSVGRDCKISYRPPVADSQLPAADLRPPTAGCSGFTLFEVIIVMMIVAMMAAIIGPAVRSGISTLRFRTAVKGLVSTLRYCRSKAISTKKEEKTEIDMDEGSYRMAGVSLSADGKGRAPAVGMLPEGALFAEWETSNETETGGIQFITFYPKGNATGGTLRIEDQRGSLLEVVIDRITGRVKVLNPDE